MQIADALALIRAVPDFPIPGILFQDISPLLADAEAFKVTIEEFAATDAPFNAVAGIESRGFILGSAVAINCDLSFLPVRKAGKLPGSVVKREYGLEYGSDALEVQTDIFANNPNPQVLLVDDVLATGGTLIAALELINDLAGQVSEVVVLLEISELGGRERILRAFPNLRIRALVTI
jgi:adenine phosphoribosyltransferase